MRVFGLSDKSISYTVSHITLIRPHLNITMYNYLLQNYHDLTDKDVNISHLLEGGLPLGGRKR